PARWPSGSCVLVMNLGLVVTKSSLLRHDDTVRCRDLYELRLVKTPTLDPRCASVRPRSEGVHSGQQFVGLPDRVAPPLLAGLRAAKNACVLQQIERIARPTVGDLQLRCDELGVDHGLGEEQINKPPRDRVGPC